MPYITDFHAFFDNYARISQVVGRIDGWEKSKVDSELVGLSKNITAAMQSNVLACWS